MELGNARGRSNQWNDWAATIASAVPSSSGSDSAEPSITRTVGISAASAARIWGSGSTAIKVAPVGTSSRVNRPVPAPRSTTTDWGAMPSASTSQATAAGG